MDFTTSDDVRISYSIQDGEEPTLVLLHGWANNRTIWNRVRRNLPQQLLLPDLRGHGKSENPQDHDAYAIERFGQDIRELLDHEQVERCVLVGHSMGGMIALTIDDPRIEGLVLLNTSAGIKDRLPIGPSPFLERIAQMFEENRELVPDDLSEHYENDFKTFLQGLNGTSLIATVRCFEEMYALDVSERLKRIDVPTLIITSEEDRILPKKFGKALGTIEGSRIEEAEGPHFSIIADADRIAQSIRRFVESL